MRLEVVEVLVLALTIAAVALVSIRWKVWFQQKRFKRQPKTPRLPPRPKSDYFPLLQSSLRECAKWLSTKEDFKDLAAQFEQLSDDLSHPLMVVVMGQFNTGKSTFINCLLEQELLVADVLPATAAVTLLSYGEKPEVLAYYRDRKIQHFPIGSLAEFSAEGSDRGKAMRQNLSHLEVRLSCALLRKVTLIDTPGLNSTEQSHKEATERFVERANAVIWLLASSQALTGTEDAAIRQLAASVRPLVVVNQIDQIDEEEESIDTTLNRIGNRLGLDSQPIGMSAMRALEAYKAADPNLLEASGWSSFVLHFNRHFLPTAILQRGTRIREVLGDQLKEVTTRLNQLHNRLLLSEKDALGGQEYINAQLEAVISLQSEAQLWTRFQQTATSLPQRSFQTGSYQGREERQAKSEASLRGSTISAMYNELAHAIQQGTFPAKSISAEVNHASELSRTIGILAANLQHLADKHIGLRTQLETTTEKRVAYHNERSKYRTRQGTFDNGNKLVQFLSFNERAILEAQDSKLNREDSSITAEETGFADQLNAIGRPLLRLAEELSELSTRIIDGLDEAISFRRQNIQNSESRVQAAHCLVVSLQWVPTSLPTWNDMRLGIISALNSDIERNTGNSPTPGLAPLGQQSRG